MPAPDLALLQPPNGADARRAATTPARTPAAFGCPLRAELRSAS
eukprot:gene11697-6376_t